MERCLARSGCDTTVGVTGDVTQIEWRPGGGSGIEHAMVVLEGVKGISFSWFKSKDVVRHNLVQKIIEAYEDHNSGDH